MKVLIVCLIIVLSVYYSSASCSTRPAKFAKHKWSKKVTVYCEYHGMKFMKGSVFTDVERCQRCTCTGKKLHCCGIGFYAGTMNIAGCKVVADQCDVAVLNPKGTGLCNKGTDLCNKG